jgi:LuxR family maltose regulon positive regulatory protein
MNDVSRLAVLSRGAEVPASRHHETPTLIEGLLSQWDGRMQLDWPGRPSSDVSDTLTVRERDVLAKISRGLSNKHIARALEISPETVKSHVKNVFLKLAVNTRAEAVYRAGSLWLLGLDSRDPHGPSRKQRTHPGQGKSVQEVPDRA